MPEPLLQGRSLDEALKTVAAAVDETLDRLLPPAPGLEAPVMDAMRYAALGGGKRLRPFLAVVSARLFTVGRIPALRVAAAIEMIHAYSLVHDDLPAMDDADLRRGRPCVHKAFDEATAILAGDGLLTRAFGVLAEDATHSDPAVRCELVRAAAEAAGSHGMVGGQMIDLLAETQTLDIGAITRLQRMKTGEMIAFACEAGAILGKAAPEPRQALKAYAHDLGLAFQIVDDLLDAEGTEAETGKSVGRDAERGKATFVSILGVERARGQAAMLSEQAVRHLEPFDERADLLREVARFMLDRRS
ncbi:farnesyl-diphosphate synthase [Allostella sp. ATCC 35155]|nr:farnesyl-diphosphate synthase [Stella sp. ATCC 35155]